MAKFVSRKKQRTTKILIIALAAVAVVAVVAIVGLLVAGLFTPKDNKDDTSIDLIYVKQAPKTTYFVGEVASYDGLIVEAVLHNGEKQEVNLDDCKITGFSSEEAVEGLKITIKYKGHTCNYTITVKDDTKHNAKVESIELISLPDKLFYGFDEYIDVTGGMILCTYSDGTTKEIALDYRHIMDWDPKVVGEYVVTVIYQEEGNGRAITTFTVTITE